MTRFTSLNLDFFGFFASALCAVHCLALPFVLTLGMLSGLEWLVHGVVEMVFIGLSLVIATWSLSRSIPRHQSRKPLRIALLGFALLLISRFIPGEALHLVTGIAGFIIAYSHWVNWKLLRRREVVSA